VSGYLIPDVFGLYANHLFMPLSSIAPSNNQTTCLVFPETPIRTTFPRIRNFLSGFCLGRPVWFLSGYRPPSRIRSGFPLSGFPAKGCLVLCLVLAPVRAPGVKPIRLSACLVLSFVHRPLLKLKRSLLPNQDPPLLIRELCNPS